MKTEKLNMIIAVSLAVTIILSVSSFFVSAGSATASMPDAVSYFKMDELVSGNENVIFDRGSPGGFNIPITTNNYVNTVRPSYSGEIFAYAYSPQKDYNYALGYGDYPLHLNQSFSVSTWFKAVQDNTAPQVIAADCPYSVSPRWKISIGTDGKVHFTWGTSDLTIDATDYFEKWTQVTFTFDGATLLAYMNGVQKSALAVTSGMLPSSYSNDRIMIGNDIAQISPFKGGIAEIKLFTSVLTEEQILSDVTAHIPAVTPDPVAQTDIRMDEDPSGTPGAFLDRGTPGGYNIPITSNDTSVVVRPSYLGEAFDFAYSPQKNYNYALGFGDYPLHLSQSFSVSVWFKAVQDNAASQVIAADCPYSGSPRWEISIETDGKVHFIWGSSGELVINKTDYFGKWTNVTFTFDGEVLRSYMNGTPGSSISVSAGMKFTSYTNDRLMLGNDIAQISPFKGGIARIALFDGSVLTDAQILAEVEKHTVVTPPENNDPAKLYEWKLAGAKSTADADKTIAANTGTAADGDMNVNSVSNWVTDHQWGTALTDRTVFSPINADGANYASANISKFNLLSSYNISFWVKANVNQTNTYVMLMSDDTAGKHTWDIHFTKGSQIKFQVWDCNSSTEYFYYFINSTPVNDGRWHQVSINYDGSDFTMQGYFDGVATDKKVMPAAARAHLANSGDTLVIGNRADKALKLDGSMANVRLFNYTLDATGTDANHAISAMIAADGGLSVLEPEVTEELKHFWKFDAIINNAVKDYGTAGNDITVAGGNIITSNLTSDNSFTVGGYTYKPGPYAISGPYSLNMKKSFTVSTWFKPSGLGTEQVIMGDAPNSMSGEIPANWQVRITNTGSLFFQWGTADNYGLDLGITVINNKWQHVAFTYDDSTKTLSGYVDGQLKKSMVIKESELIDRATLGQRFMIGNNLLQGKLFRGKIHNIRVYSYDQTLSGIATDIQSDAPNGVPDADESVPLAKEHEWKLNNASADPTYGLVTWDSAGGANIVVANSAEYVSDSVFGHAYSPAGNGSVLTATKGPAGDGYSFEMMEPFVISAWINVKQSPNKEIQTIVADGPYEQKTSWALRINKYGELFFQMGIDTSYGIKIKNTTFYNSWTNVTITFDGGETLRAYLDGKKEAEMIVNPVKPRQQSSKDRVMIGNSVEQVEYLRGAVSNVRLYSGTMTDSEVLDKIINTDKAEYPALAAAMTNKKEYIAPAGLYDEEISHDMDIVDESSDSVAVEPEAGEPEASLEDPDIDSSSIGEPVFDTDDSQTSSVPNKTELPEKSVKTVKNYTLLYVAISLGFVALMSILAFLIMLINRKKRSS